MIGIRKESTKQESEILIRVEMIFAHQVEMVRKILDLTLLTHIKKEMGASHPEWVWEEETFRVAETSHSEQVWGAETSHSGQV